MKNSEAPKWVYYSIQILWGSPMIHEQSIGWETKLHSFFLDQMQKQTKKNNQIIKKSSLHPVQNGNQFGMEWILILLCCVPFLLSFHFFLIGSTTFIVEWLSKHWMCILCSIASSFNFIFIWFRTVYFSCFRGHTTYLIIIIIIQFLLWFSVHSSFWNVTNQNRTKIYSASATITAVQFVVAKAD